LRVVLHIDVLSCCLSKIILYFISLFPVWLFPMRFSVNTINTVFFITLSVISVDNIDIIVYVDSVDIKSAF